MTLADAPPGAGRPHAPSARRPDRAHRVLAIRVLAYVTNHVVSHVPSFALRRALVPPRPRRDDGARRGRPPRLLV